jgi:hypothetical protein
MVGICLTFIISSYVLGSLSAYQIFPKISDTMHWRLAEASTFVAILGVIQCYRIGGGVSNLILSGANLDQYSRPTDPIVIEFAEEMQKHPRWLTLLAGLGYVVFYGQALFGTMLILIRQAS